MLVGALTMGAVTLTGAVVSGIVWAHRLYHAAWMTDPKILFTLAIWVLYTAALLLRRLRRWQGRQMAWAAIAGLLSILFSLVAINVWYHVGSGYETVGKSGFAHLFEHMLFQGSAHVGSDRHFEVLKNIGADSVNGTTNLDRTNYFEVVPSNQLEAGLWLESDRMAYLLPKLTKESLDNQIEVVRNERRQRYDNVPYGKARFALFEALYPEGHPYRYLTIGRNGSVSDIAFMRRTSGLTSTQIALIYGGVALMHVVRIARDGRFADFFVRPGNPAGLRVGVDLR